MAKKKVADKPKFSDAPDRSGMLVKECPTCGKYHHPRSAACPNCGHAYSSRKTGKKSVAKKRPAARAAAPSRNGDPLDAGIKLVAACRGDVTAARRVLDTIETIQKL